MRPLLALVGLLAAGCLGHCSPAYSAAWHDASFYGALAAAADRVEGALVEEAPPPGLPFEAAAVDPAWTEGVVAQVSWRPEDDEGRHRFTGAVLRPDEVEVTAPDDATAVRLLDEFLANATRDWRAATPEARRAAEERFLASRSDAARVVAVDGEERTVAHVYTLPAPPEGWDVDASVVEGAASRTGGPGPTGVVHADAGDGWSLTVRFPTRTLAVEDVVFVADPSGTVEARLGPRDDLDAAGAAALVRARAEAAGLPAPTLGPEDMQAVVC